MPGLRSVGSEASLGDRGPLKERAAGNRTSPLPEGQASRSTSGLASQPDPGKTAPLDRQTTALIQTDPLPADGFATLVRWPNVSAEQFMIDENDEQPARPEPELGHLARTAPPRAPGPRARGRYLPGRCHPGDGPTG